MSAEVGNLKGDVFALVSMSKGSNVFARTELLSSLLYKDGTINGISRSELYNKYEIEFSKLLAENPKVSENDIKYYELRTQALEVALKPVMDRCDEIIEDIYVCVNDEIDNDSFELDLSGSEFFHHQKNPEITSEYTRIPFREYMKAAEEIGQMLGEGKAIFKCDPNPTIGKVEKLSSNIADIRPQTVSLYMQGKEIRQMYVGVIETRKKDVEKQHTEAGPEKGVSLTFDLNRMLENKGADAEKITEEQKKKMLEAVTKLDLKYGSTNLSKLKIAYKISKCIDAELGKAGIKGKITAEEEMVARFEKYKEEILKQQGITEPEKADCQTEKKEFLKIVKSDKSTVAELTKCFDKVKEKGKEAKEQGGQNREKSEKKSKNDQDRCL